MQRPLIGLIAIAVAGLCARPALAEQWRWFPVKGGAVAFDQDSLEGDVAAGVMAANTVIFYDPPRPVGARAYSFVAERLEFECRADRHRWSQSAILDASGAAITSREDGDWTRIGADKGSIGLFRRMICLGQTPPGGEQAKDLATLIAAVGAMPSPAAPVAKVAPLDLDALMARLAETPGDKAKPAPPKPAPPKASPPAAPKKPGSAPRPAAAKPALKLRPLTLP